MSKLDELKDKLYKDLRHDLMIYAKSKTKNKSIQEDAVQEGLLKVFETITDDETSGSYSLRAKEWYWDKARNRAKYTIEVEHNYQSRKMSYDDIDEVSSHVVKNKYGSKTPTASELNRGSYGNGDDNM